MVANMQMVKARRHFLTSPSLLDTQKKIFTNQLLYFLLSPVCMEKGLGKGREPREGPGIVKEHNLCNRE